MNNFTKSARSAGIKFSVIFFTFTNLAMSLGILSILVFTGGMNFFTSLSRFESSELFTIGGIGFITISMLVNVIASIFIFLRINIKDGGPIRQICFTFIVLAGIFAYLSFFWEGLIVLAQAISYFIYEITIEDRRNMLNKFDA